MEKIQKLWKIWIFSKNLIFGLFGPFWAILGHFGPFQSFWAYLALFCEFLKKDDAVAGSWTQYDMFVWMKILLTNENDAVGIATDRVSMHTCILTVYSPPRHLRFFFTNPKPICKMSLGGGSPNFRMWRAHTYVFLRPKIPQKWKWNFLGAISGHSFWAQIWENSRYWHVLTSWMMLFP